VGTPSHILEINGSSCECIALGCAAKASVERVCVRFCVDQGLPLGMQLIGKRYHDHEVLLAAAALEQGTQFQYL